jgi:ABC-type antimicrobial peptide transport system permease subunit
MKGASMIKNYFITSFRNFWRNKVFSVINVLGLSIGISAALVIFLIVHFELGYDKFEPGGERIYRVVMDMKFNGNDGHSAAVMAPLANAVQREVTGVEQTVPVMTFQGDGTAEVSISKEGADKPTVFKKQPDIVFTNPQYFYLMPHQWIAGSPNASLKNPFTVVLSESRAQQYFPSLPALDIIGKTIKYNDDITVTVSGIVKDVHEHTGFTAVEFISYATIAQTHLQNDFMMHVWDDWMAYSQLYIKLAAGTDKANIESQLKSLLVKYNKNAYTDAQNYMRLKLQPLSDVHFNSLYASFNQRVAHLPTLYGLLAIAAFLLILGCINFINLTTANASQRAKEIGIRKTMGSSKKQLVLQFLGETFFITCIATIISVALTPVLLNLFKNFTPPGLEFNLFHQPYIFLFLFLLTLFVSFISGFYPALILSGYKPALVLKGLSLVSSGETRHAWIRKMLTVSQFVIAQFFIIATMMVSKQINYSLNADMGFRKDAIISFNVPRQDTVANHRTELLAAIKNIPGVQMASRGFLAPADEGAAFTDISYAGAANNNKESVQLRWGDSNYLKLFDIKILAGRNVEESDTIKEFLINETYAKSLGFKHPQDAINKMLDYNGKKLPVVGVMHDFNEQSFHAEVGPLVFAGFNNRSYFIHVLLQPQNANGTAWKNTISKIQKAYSNIYPGEDFDYKFFDDTIAKFYEAEQKTSTLLTWATGLAILISCLGLLGLVMYTINTRTKEIGIRKILGASVTNILSVLSTDFLKLVCIAFLIAAPAAWWASYKWLEDFAYRTAMSWWVFALAGICMLLMALLTLSLQTIKAAIANPVKSLRAE